MPELIDQAGDHSSSDDVMELEEDTSVVLQCALSTNRKDLLQPLRSAVQNGK